MGTILHEKTYGCYPCRSFVSYVQKWSTLPLANVGHSIEVGRHRCEVVGFHMENHDEPSWYYHGRHLQCLLWFYHEGLQQSLLDHQVEERQINCTLMEAAHVGVDEDVVDQWLGRFLGLITGGDPSVCKSNGLHVHILRLSFIELGYIL